MVGPQHVAQAVGRDEGHVGQAAMHWVKARLDVIAEYLAELAGVDKELDEVAEPVVNLVVSQTDGGQGFHLSIDPLVSDRAILGNPIDKLRLGHVDRDWLLARLAARRGQGSNLRHGVLQG